MHIFSIHFRERPGEIQPREPLQQIEQQGGKVSRIKQKGAFFKKYPLV